MDDYGYDEKPRWHRLAAILLLTVAAVAAAFTVGRLTAPSSGPERPAAVAAQPGPGPTRVVNGVPVGYAHTQDGAVAAATNFLVVMGGQLLTQQTAYVAAVATMAAPEAQTSLSRYATTTLDAFQGSGVAGFAQQGRAVALRTIPLAYHVDTYSELHATVRMWAEGIAAVDGYLTLRETWSTSVLNLEWVGADWKLVSNGGGTAGPAPLTIQPPIQTSRLPEQLHDFKAYHYDVGG